MDEKLQKLLNSLGGVKELGDQKWQACCPAHDDNRASLSITETTDGTVLVKCHAGCPTTDVLAGVGMNLADLFPRHQSNGHANGQSRIVDEYTYRDIGGELLFQVVRFDPKGFRQRRPKDGGGWEWRVKGTKIVPYRLPELAAADTEKTVFVVEGEKDVDRLRSLGMIATCNAGGAGKWRDEHASYLAGRRMVIVPDNDDAGLKHAQQVAKSLAGRAASVKIVAIPGLPDKGDISDWLDGGGTIEELAELVAMQPDWQPPKESRHQRAKTKDGDEEGRSSAADKLVALALARYRIGRNETDDAFAVEIGGPNVALMFRGSRDALRSALARAYRAEYGRVPNAAALADALTVLQGEAYVAEPEPVYLRVAEHDGAIIVDLGDASGRAVAISPGDWNVIDRSPVLFRRTAATGILPAPKRGGSLTELRGLLNVTADTWPLAMGWLIAALVPNMPHPILLLGGQQGTGKTTATKKLIGVVDPSPAPVRSHPRDVETWAITAAGSWVVAVDNVSTIPDWWSDSLCKAVTGDGWLRRKLYTDGDLAVLSFRRVIILNSIDPGALRGDLGDRVLLVDLHPITDLQRRSESDIDRAYGDAQPRIFGALLDLLSKVLAELPKVELVRLPRMADFGRLLAAMDRVLGDDSDGPALDIYLGQRERVAETVVESDPVALAIQKIIEDTGGWEGTMAELLEKITPEKPPREWPKGPRALTGRIKRLAPALEQVGIFIEHLPRCGKRRVLTIYRKELQDTVTTVTSSLSPENTEVFPPGAVTVGDGSDEPWGRTVTSKHTINTEEDCISDDSDCSDDVLQPVSKWGEI